ncbi:MAG: iron transporter [Candidatus Doudnabacteria bacterium RIFCSPHIGHO2_01_FULL_50_11]|uniref:Iron transporter n=1 Tax=Candidatus Doudnabacteria bacterium RIFCSPHIGHO2_01_FULL_50_11 TaxID=1817828 RepID=A0A1F5PEV5_9BACT|nr:MAG: iron transporter [Candidatus Doudnabacteria bacterium RIFCSPHIGHO2_01_FULL_50_11]
MWRLLGPGWVTGAADDDPSGIATYSQAGAGFGNQFLWLAALTFPLMAIVQDMCARIGLVTGRGLASNIRRHFSRRILFFLTVLLLVANIFNLGVDLGAMAAATQLLVPQANFAFLVILFTLASVTLQVFVSYRGYARYLKWLSFILLSYVFSALLVGLDWGQVLKNTFVPTLSFTRDQIYIVCAVLGTTISPYLFFWETSQEVEEEILEGKTTVLQREQATGEEIRLARVDTWIGMFFSNIVMFFIIAVTSATLHEQGIFNVTSAAQAAAALRPLAGSWAALLFTLGIIASGLLALPVLAASASYALCETLGWREGLFHKLRSATAFYYIIIAATVIGLLLNFIGMDPIRALIYAAVINGLVAPLVLIPIVLLSSNKKVMRDAVNGRILTLFGWLIVAIMSVVGIATLATL